MSVSLFDAVPAGAIEVIFDEKNQPWFKRADIGRFLGLNRIKDMFHDIETVSRVSLLKGAVQNSPLQRQNSHDAFVTLDAALEIVVRSRKPKAVELTKWLTHKGVEKVVEEHQKAIDAERHKVQEKDTQLALLNDDLTESQKLVKQFDKWATKLQYNK